MAAAKNTLARKARSVPRRAKHRPPSPDSAAGILSAVRLRLKSYISVEAAGQPLQTWQ
jgi:hypothetical protein